MSDEVLLRAEGLRKLFVTPAQTVEVLKGVDLTLKRGEMVALLGSSGAGKSTLTQILGSLDRPSGGKVFLNGEDLFALSEGKRAQMRNRHIGFVYQFHHLLAEFSALENVMIPLLIGRMDKKEAALRSGRVLEEVGLGERLHHRPRQLSGGEQQRVAIARAIVTDPDLLLADEPTGNLDNRTAAGVLSLLLELNRKRHLTCLVVTHNLEIAHRLDRRIRLLDGNLTEVEEN